MHPNRVTLFSAILLAVGEAPFASNPAKVEYWKTVSDMVEAYLDSNGVYGKERPYLAGDLRRAYCRWTERERARRINQERIKCQT